MHTLGIALGNTLHHLLWGEGGGGTTGKEPIGTGLSHHPLEWAGPIVPVPQMLLLPCSFVPPAAWVPS